MKQDIQVIIVYKALGFLSDREIVKYINYHNDQGIHSFLNSTLEEAAVIQDQLSAFDFIGKGSAPVGAPIIKEFNLLGIFYKMNFYPYIGRQEFCEAKKAYFLGYKEEHKCYIREESGH